jgi:hypothetical protein
MISKFDVGGFLTDAIGNMKRYWLNREHFAYTVEYHTGNTTEEFAVTEKAGITIFKSVEPGDNRWIMTLEIPMTAQRQETGNAKDTDGVWEFFEDLQKKYPSP